MQNKVSYIVIIVLALVCLILSMKLGRDDQSNKVNAATSTVQTASTQTVAVNEAPVPTVAVFTREKKRFVADEYVMTVNLTMLGTDKKVLYRKMNEKRASLFKVLNSFNIPESNVDQNSIKIEKEWSYDEGKRKFLGFRSTQKFEVHVESKSLQKSLTQALSTDSDIEVTKSLARSKNVTAWQADVVKEMCKKAFAKAENYARGTGAKLGKIVLVEGDVDQNNYATGDSVQVIASMNLEMELLSEGAASASKPSLLSVRNLESRKYGADEFKASFKIQMVGKDKESLYKLVESRGAAILAHLDSLEIPRTDVKDFDIDINKNRSYSRKRTLGEFHGYTATKHFSVYVKSMKTASMLVDALALESDVEITGVKPTLKNADSLTSEMQILTGKNAMAKARVFAEGLGMKVGRVMFANDGIAKQSSLPWLKTNVYRDYDDEVYFEDHADGLSMVLGGGDYNSGSNAAIADSVEVSAKINYVIELK